MTPSPGTLKIKASLHSPHMSKTKCTIWYNMQTFNRC